MPLLGNALKLDRCPHCGIAHPFLASEASIVTRDYEGDHERAWIFYKCSNCGGVVTATAEHGDAPVREMFPEPPSLPETIPDKARKFLGQAMDSLHAPAGAVMLAASSVDAMLKEKGFDEGSLYARINQAKDENLITEGMATWAHEIRLDANDQRHADVDAPLPTPDSATKCIEFAKALAQFLFVLPSMVQRGLEQAQQGTPSEQGDGTSA